MTFFLADVVPWGRTYEEYVRFFDLSAHDLERRIIGCADGPASFNSGLTALGGSIVSCDPLYRFSGEEIRARIEQCWPEIREQVERNKELFIWESVSSPEELAKWRRSAMRMFLKDYETGRRDGRYCAACLPYLPFLDKSFDLAICSHLLFYYSDTLTESFHRAAIREMLRVAREVRIFPLVDLNGHVSRYLDIITADLVNNGFEVEIRTVLYQFIRGGNQVLIISGTG
jgi:SAM-dependent methyltransferase